MTLINTALGAAFGGKRVRAICYGDEKIVGATNLLANPSFETTSGTVEVRRNYATMPKRAQAILFGGGAGTTSEPLDPRWAGGKPLRAAWTSAPAPAGIPYAALKTGIQFAIGEVWTISARYELSGSSASLVNISIGGSAPPANSGTALSLTDHGDGTLTASRTFTITGIGSGTALGDVILTLAPGAGVDTVFTVGDVLLEKSPAQLPYFDGDTPIRLRRNHSLSPQMRQGGRGVAWVTGTDSSGASYFDAGSNAGTKFINISAGVGFSPGQKVRVLLEVKTTTLTSVIIVHNAANAMGASASSNTGNSGAVVISDIVPGVWKSIDTTKQLGTAADVRGLIAYLQHSTPGERVAVRNVAYFPIEDTGDFFDGSSPGAAWAGGADASLSYTIDPDLTPSWTAAKDASASVLRGDALAGVTSSGSPKKVYASTRRARGGVRSLRITPISTSLDTNADVGGISTLSMNAGLVAGGTYTVLGTIHLDAALTGPLSPAGRGIEVVYNNVPGWTGASYVRKAQAPNEPGDHEVRQTFTIPPDAVWAAIRLFNGAAAGGGDVWWDDVMLVEGEYAGPYRDGDSPGWYWTGPDHASASCGWQ